jgi:type IV pilus assembly protein PilC
MPRYIYVGVSTSGNQVRGEMMAGTKDEVVSLLRKKKIRPLSISSKPFSIGMGLFKGVGLKDLSRFTRQFSAMTSAGLPLVQCLDVLADQTENKNLNRAVRQISADIQGGNTLADAMKKHPAIFSILYCNMVSAGEASGSLDVVLRRLAEYQEKTEALRRKIVGAMAYPGVVATVAVGVTIIMLTFVVPTFAQMFTETGGTLPMPTQIVINLSNFLQKFGLYLIALAIAAVAAVIMYYRTDNGKLVIDTIVLKTPVFGDLIRKSAVSRFSQTLATLLTSGITILDALSVTAKTAGNKVLENGLQRTLEKISGGLSIAEPLKQTGVFPPMVIHMVAVGEKTGDLAEMLAKVAEFYSEEVDAAVDALTALLEPIMIVIMGALVGGILIAMYLPMFSMINTIG